MKLKLNFKLRVKVRKQKNYSNAIGIKTLEYRIALVNVTLIHLVLCINYFDKNFYAYIEIHYDLYFLLISEKDAHNFLDNLILRLSVKKKIISMQQDDLQRVSNICCKINRWKIGRAKISYRFSPTLLTLTLSQCLSFRLQI